MQAMQQLASSQRLAQRKLDTKIEQLRRKRDAEVDTVERKLQAQVRREQDRQKWLAVLLPPIPPLVVAFFVIKKFLAIVTKYGLKPFGWYRIAAGIALIGYLAVD